MSRFYTDPHRESDRYSLPDAEVFYVSARECRAYRKDDPDTAYTGPGWYVWACFPGCMPDSDPEGPYATEAEAVAEWRATYGSRSDDDYERQDVLETITREKIERERAEVYDYNHRDR